MFRKKNKSKFVYEVKGLGALEVFRTQHPTTIDFEYEKHSIVTWRYDLRFGKNGPCLLSKTYVVGDTTPFIKIGVTSLKDCIKVSNTLDSDFLFYNDVLDMFGV